MAKLPIIDVNPDAGNVSGQQNANPDDFVPGWRQVEGALRARGAADSELFQGGEAEALAEQRRALSSGEIGEAIQRTADPMEKRFKQIDMSSQQVAASRLHMQWAKHAMDRIKSGDVHDPNLTDSFLQDFDDNTADMVNSAQSDEGKMYITHALAEMRAQFGTQVMLGQSERAGQQIKKDALELTNNRSETARVNPAMLPQILKDHARDSQLTASMLGGSQEQSEALRLDGGKVISVAALEGLVLTNPHVVKQQSALPLNERDPIFQAASKYVNGETMNRIRANADARIKNDESEKRQQLVLARQEEQRSREMQAGAIFNAIGDKKATLPDGTPIKNAIAKLAASGAGFHLAENLSNVFKASGLDGTSIGGSNEAFLAAEKNIASGNSAGWTVDKLHLMHGSRDTLGQANGFDDQQLAHLVNQLDRRSKPENQMDDLILRSAIQSADAEFTRAGKMFAGLDKSGFVAGQKTAFLIDIERQFRSRRDGGEHAMDILDPNKPNTLGKLYQKYIPTFKDIQSANKRFREHPPLDPVKVAREQGMPDPESYGKVAVARDPANPYNIDPITPEQQPLLDVPGIMRNLAGIPTAVLGKIKAALSDDELDALDKTLERNVGRHGRPGRVR